MREIKFRVWSGYDMIQSTEWFIEVDDGSVWENYNDDDAVDRLREDYEAIPMQYTGLKDKNGVEIYASDNLRCPDGWGGIVYWCESELQWWCKDHDLANLNKPEVVGNIYENPELL